MKKSKIITVISVLLLTLSTYGQNKHSITYIRQRIAIIYQNVGKATYDAEGNQVDYIHNHFNRDSAYCSQRYYTLMKQALEICNKKGDILFDYDHWVCGQDFSDDWSCKVANIYNVTDSTALVDLIIHNFNNSETTIALRFERNDWYIDDFSPSDDGEDDKAYFRRIISNTNTMTFTEVAGVYETLDENMNSVSRFVLMADGTATWCMIGSLNYTKYTYTIQGNTICLTPKDIDTENDCYDYDSNTRSMKNEQGTIYYRQIE